MNIINIAFFFLTIGISKKFWTKVIKQWKKETNMNTIQVYISKLYHLHKSISQTHAQK